ncbi:MAG TPA: trehalose-6-phosphate synthase [Gemmatimonadaceae bacterium]|jgi:trehalose 6-phosphate synthase/phosphatase|nr:trehalose-6-phosphate synthase [Gemmatimonadaceae bacterium]
MGRLIIVSNRLPITVTGCGDEIEVAPSAGGLATGLASVHDGSESLWVGWSGLDSNASPEARRSLQAQLTSRRLVEVPLSADEVSIYYEHIANGVLWPIFHDQLERLPNVIEGWDTYEAVNARYADMIVACARPGDTIWIHDFQLMRVPALLRERLPGVRIGFFLHIPFPNPEIFFALPRRQWLVEGMLGADLIGFHTRRYRGHFTAALRRLLGIEMYRESIAYDGRTVNLGIFPMGVDGESFAARSRDRKVVAEMARLRSDEGMLLVGIDRLDYSKGLPRRLLAFERLLTTHPEWLERIRLVQVAVPSRETLPAYKSVRRNVEELVGRINGRFGTHRWTPIRYINRSVSPTILSALYRAADVLLVTPLRDGMNLVAKEFVASRTDGDGVLVLSEFAGAADELTQAVMVNPYDVDGMAESFNYALRMPEAERRERMQSLRAHVMSHDVSGWAANFLAQLASTTT